MVGSGDSETFGCGFDSRHLQWHPSKTDFSSPPNGGLSASKPEQEDDDDANCG